MGRSGKKTGKKKSPRAQAPVQPQQRKGDGRASVAAMGIETRSAWSPVLHALLIFLISTPVIFGPYGQHDGYTPNLHMAAYIQVGVMVILSLFMLSTLARKHVTVSRSPLLLPLLLFYAWAMLSVLWTHTKYEAIVDALIWSGAFVCAVLIVLILRDVRALKVMLTCLMISGLLVALLGVGQYLFGVDWVQQHVVPAATFSNKNMAGQYAVLTLPIAIVSFLRSRNNFQVWLFAAAIALFMAFIFYTRSRGVWVAFAVETLALAGGLLYLKRRHGYHPLGNSSVKKVALATALALFLGLAYLTPAILGNVEKVEVASIGAKPGVLSAEHGGEVLQDVVGDFTGSARGRVIIWMNSIPMFLDHWLVGVGLGNWTIHYPKHQSSFQQDPHMTSYRYHRYHENAHNDYIEILCEFGIIGFALFAWVAVGFFRAVGRLLSQRDEDYFLLAMLLTTVVLGIAANAVFSFPLKQPVPSLMVMVYLAVISNLYGMSVEKGRDLMLPMPPVPVRGVAAGVVILATVGLFVLQLNWYNSELHYRESVLLMRDGKYREAFLEGQRAYELNPLRARLLPRQAISLLTFGGREEQERGIEMLKEMERAYPYSLTTLLHLSKVYGNLGRHEESIQAIRRVVEVQPNVPNIRHRLGRALLLAGRYEEALEQFENWVIPHRVKRLQEVERESAEGKTSSVSVPEIVAKRRKQVAKLKRTITKIKAAIRGRQSTAETLKDSTGNNP